jgi:hypothetical protein
MIINRTIRKELEDAINNSDRKVIVLYGPRQAGKTTLIEMLLSEELNYKKYNGDDIFTQNIFSNNNLENLKRSIGEKDFLIIDEAQRINNIGLSLKLIIDNLPVKIIVSGSVSFDLASKVCEPLTGRTKTFWLYPLSLREVKDKIPQMENDKIIEEILLYGMYPKVWNIKGKAEKEDYLFEYINNYLYRDILTISKIKKPKKVVDLLTLLALQIGSEVSISELAKNTNLTQATVENYLDILEKMFVIFNIRGFSRNLRKEISKTSKYYFFDMGVRNALIRNFNPLSLRNDTGEMFENWVISEKIKKSNNSRVFSNFYFWRTYDQQEIDLIEESKGKIIAYECKWKKNVKKVPNDWRKTYPQSKFNLINKDNAFNFLLD